MIKNILKFHQPSNNSLVSLFSTNSERPMICKQKTKKTRKFYRLVNCSKVCDVFHQVICFAQGEI